MCIFNKSKCSLTARAKCFSPAFTHCKGEWTEKGGSNMARRRPLRIRNIEKTTVAGASLSAAKALY